MIFGTGSGMSERQRPALDNVVSYVAPLKRQTSARYPELRDKAAVIKENVVNVAGVKSRCRLAHGFEHTLPAG
jgi:hypothetical protein